MKLPDDDFVLLRRYADGRDQSAIAELMQRYIDLVYSASQRRVGDRSLAEDVTQATFIILARKAKSIRRRSREPLSAWLLNTVRYAAANAVKMERRRQKHEREAAAHPVATRPGACSVDPTDVIIWQEIAQQLDDAVLRLQVAHRRVMLLRYFKDMEPGNLSWVRFGKDTFPETTGKAHFQDDRRTCVLPVKLRPGHPYVIWLNKAPYDSFMDKGGHKAVPYLLVFETKP